jgi:hypothetical protein
VRSSYAKAAALNSGFQLAEQEPSPVLANGQPLRPGSTGHTGASSPLPSLNGLILFATDQRSNGYASTVAKGLPRVPTRTLRAIVATGSATPRGVGAALLGRGDLRVRLPGLAS